jgi:hypothetical protein
MEAAKANPTNFKYTQGPKLPVVGEVLVASGWLLAIGLLNLFYAIAVIAGSDIFITTASWLVGDVRPWGGLMLGISLVQLATVPALITVRWWALWVALLSVAAHIAAVIMFFGDSPLIALGLLLVDLIVLVCILVTATAVGQE